jgi:hypothetical protein
MKNLTIIKPYNILKAIKGEKPMSEDDKKYRKIDLASYELIKRLAEHGLSKKDICKTLCISPATYYRVMTSKDIYDYRNIVNTQAKEAKARQRARKIAAAKTKVEVVNNKTDLPKKAVVEFSEIEFKTHTGPQLNIIMDLLKQQIAGNNAIIESLEQINSKLDNINSRPSKKRWH